MQIAQPTFPSLSMLQVGLLWYCTFHRAETENG